jgi:hypothetical protein
LIRRLAEQAAWLLWLLMLACLPVTSFPQISKLLGAETPVAPLASLPLALLILIWLIPWITRGGRLPTVVWPLLVFVFLALISAGQAFFLPILPDKGQLPLDRELRTLVTLACGFGFYLCAATQPSDERRVIWSLRALYFGAFVAFAWGSVQAWVALGHFDHTPLVITRIHHIFSVRDPLQDRITGMTYEPSWFGDQLVIVYLPLLLASVLQRRSVFSSRRTFLSVELLMLPWGLFLLLMTYSRISFVSLALQLSVLALVGAWKVVDKLIGLTQARNRLRQGRMRLTFQLLGMLLVVGSLAAASLAAGWALSRVDERMRNLFAVRTRLVEANYLYPNEAIFNVADRLSFAERVVYWTTAFRTFGEYPILGVGPGNAGFYFEENLPAYGYQLTEIRRVIETQNYGFPNPKNLWVKILAEDGIVGFSAYFVWIVMLTIAALAAWRKVGGFAAVIGLAAFMTLIGQLIEGFSLDSYALPNLWIMLGMLTAIGLSSLGIGDRPQESGTAHLNNQVC